MKVQAFLISLLLLTLVSSGESRSLDGQQCSTSCAAQTNFNYAAGVTYNYQYVAEVQSSFFAVPNSQDQESHFNMRADVAIDVMSPCEHALRVSRISLDSVDHPQLTSSDWAASIERNPMFFSWQDGTIADVCASNDDPEWVLNIKRGIISALQVSSPNDDNEAVVETDVTGTCASSYSIDYNQGGVKTVHKNKDFNSCKDHEKLLLFSHFTPYSSESQRQRLMIQNQTCVQTISGSVVQSSECSEEHLFRPFSSDENGARTTVRQSLQLVEQVHLRNEAVFSSNQVRRTTLAFEKEPASSAQQDITEIRTFFGELCHNLDYSSNSEYTQVGKDFVNLTFLLRRLDGPAIGQAFSSLDGVCMKHEEVIKSMFKDALKWCGSEGCVQFGTELIARGPDVLDDATSLKWLLGMNMISDPTSAMVEGLLEVLQSGRFPEQTYLTTGTIIHGICSKTENCLSQSSVRSALNFMEEKLGGNCYTPNEQLKQNILLALRAIGNAGRSTAVNTLATCAKEQRNDAETRIAAMQAFRRMPCGTDRSLESVVFNTEEDSEIRIGAYTTTMKCPTTSFMSKLVLMLDAEPSQQVASFVSSHLQNLIASSDPLKGYIKPYLVEAEFAKTYDLDARKFSKYHEISYFSEPLNAGVNAEGSLVWSPKSFVPRSAGLNLTVDVFGQAVNLLELGGRVEGMENLLQDMMKKKSFLQNTGIGNIFGADGLDEEEIDESEESEEEETTQLNRLTSETQINEKTKQFQDTINKDQFGASWYVRVFGNELKYGNSRFPDVYQQINEEVSSVVMDIAKGKKVRYHDDMLLVNTAHTLPTMVGLPLTLAVNGSASIDVVGSGSMDLSSLLSTTPELAMNVEFYPQATVVFNGAMRVDAHIVSSGIETESTALMSWKVSGRAALANGKKFSLRIDTPEADQSVFKFEHKLFKTGLYEKTIPHQNVYYNDVDCQDLILGQGYCIVKSDAENLSVFPPSGAVGYNFYFTNREAITGDPAAKYFQFDLSYDYVTDEQAVPSYIMGDISLDCDLEHSPHRHHLKFEFERDAGTVSSTLQYPTYDGPAKIDLSAEYSQMENQHTVRVTMNENGVEKRLMQTSFMNGLYDSAPQMSLDSNMYIMGQNRNVQMAFACTPSKTMSFNTTFTNFLDRPIEFKIGLGDESNEARNRYLFRGNALAVIPGMYENGAELELSVKPRPDNYAVALAYTILGEDQQSFRFVHKNMDSDNEQELTYKFVSTQFPQFNALLTTNHQQTSDSFTSSAKLAYGVTAMERNNEDYISLSQMFSTAGSNDDRTQMTGNIEILFPLMYFRKQLSWTLAVDQVELDSVIRYNGNDFFQLTVRDEGRSAGLMSKYLKVQIPTPWDNIILDNSLQEIRKDVYKLNGAVKVGHNVGMEFITSALVENLVDRKSLKFDISGDGNVIIGLYSEHSLLEPSGFSSNNSIQSAYFQTATLNLRHQASTVGNFKSELLFDYAPHYHYKINLGLDSQEQESMFNTNIEFTDNYAQLRQFNLVTQHSTVPQDSEDARFVASVDITTNAIRGFSEAEADFVYSSQSPSFSVRQSVSVDRRETFAVALEYNKNEENTHSVSASLNQEFTDEIPFTNAVSVSVTDSADQTGVEINYQDQLVLEFTVTDRIVGTLQNSLFEEYPQQYQIMLSQVAQGVEARISADRQVLNFRARSQSSRLLLDLENTFRMLNMVPQRLSYDLSWGTNNDEMMGAWSTLTVDNQQSQIEALCGQSSCHLSFDPRGLTVNGVALPTLFANVNFDLANQVYTAQMTFNDEKLIAAEVDLSEMIKISMEQQLSESLPGLVKVVGKVEGNHYEFDLVWEETYTVLSLDAKTESSDFDIKAKYFSNCSMIAGNHELGFTLNSNKAEISIKLNKDTGSLALEWNDTSASFNFEQTFIYGNQYLPNLMHLDVSGSASETTLNLQYNDKMIRFWTTMEQRSDSVSVSTSRFQQNFFQGYNDLAFKTIKTIENEYVTIHETIMKIDDKPEVYEKHILTVGLPEDGLLKYKYEFTSNFNENTYPSDFSAEFFYPADYRIRQYGFNIHSTFPEPLYNFDFDSKVDITNNGFVFTNKHTNGLIALLTQTEVFNYNFVLDVTTNEGFSAKCDVALNPQDTYSVLLEANGRVGKDLCEINTNIETNVFELLSLGMKLPNKFETNTRVGYNVDSDSLSGRTSFDMVITRVYSNDITLDNNINFEFGAQLFNWNFELSGKHDFEFEFLPKIFRYELLMSGSTDASPVYYKSLSLSVTTGETKQTATISFNRNSADHSMYFVSTHNVSMLMEYGVPGNMSVAFRKKSEYDFDLSVVYDTERKSVGFNFDYVSDINKVMLGVYHNFDNLVEMLNIPKVMAIEGQYQLNEQDYFSNFRTQFGEDIRESEFNLRWEGEDLSSITSLTYRHQQNFTQQPYMPQKLRIKLTRSFDNAEFGARFAIDEAEIRSSFSYEVTGGEYSHSFYVSQNIDSKVFPRRLKVTGTLNTEEPHIDMKIKTSNKNLLDLNADYLTNGDEKKITVIIEQALFEDASPMIEFTLTNLMNAEQFNLGLDMSYSDDMRFEVELQSGINSNGNSFYVQLTHDQAEWKQLGLPRMTRLDGQAYLGDVNDVNLRLFRDEVENNVATTISFTIERSSISVSTSMNHDISEIVQVVPTNVNVRFYGEYSPDGVLASLNATLNEDVFAHTLNLYIKPTENGLTIGASFMHDNQYLTELEVPNTVAVKVVGEQSEGSISGNVMFNYGEQTFVAQTQAYMMNGLPQLRSSFTIRSPAVNYDGDVKMALTTENIQAALLLNGVDQASVTGSYSLKQVRFVIHQLFETEILPTDITFAFSNTDENVIDLSFEYVQNGSPTSASISYRPTSSGSIITLQVADEEVKEFVAEYNLDKTSFSLRREQNFFTDRPRVAVFSTSFEVDTDKPHISASVRLDDTVHTLSAQGDLNELDFTFEHDLPISFIPNSINVKIGYALEPTIIANVNTIVDEVERSISFDLDTTNNIYKLVQTIPELSDFPKTTVLEFGLESSNLRVSLTMDSQTRAVSMSSSEQAVALSHSIPELAYMIPTNIDISAQFNPSSGNAAAKWTLDGTDNGMSFEYDLRPNRVRIHFAQEGLPAVPTTLLAELTLSVDYHNMSANLQLSNYFFNFKSGVLMGDNEEGWYGMSVTANHNIPALSDYLEQSTSTFLFKVRAFEAQAVINNGRDTDYSATSQLTWSIGDYDASSKFAYDQYLNGDHDSVKVNLASQTNRNNRVKFQINANHVTPRRTVNNINLDFEGSVDNGFMTRFLFDGAQNYESLRNMPHLIEKGSFEITVTPEENQLESIMTVSVDEEDIDFNFRASASAASENTLANVRLSFNSRAVRLQNTLDLEDRQAYTRFSYLNYYQDRSAYRNDRISMEVSHSIESTVFDLAFPIKELEGVIPTSYSLEITRRGSNENNIQSYLAKAGEYQIRMTINSAIEESAFDVSVEVNQNLFEPNAIMVRVNNQDPADSLSITLDCGPSLNANIVFTDVPSAKSVDIGLSSSESTFNTKFTYHTDSGISWTMDNGMVLELPTSAEFTFRLSPDGSVRSNFDYGDKNYFTLSYIGKQLTVTLNNIQVPIQINGDFAAGTIRAIVDNTLILDGKMYNTLEAYQVVGSAKGELYGYKFSELVDLGLVLDEDGSIRTRLQMDTSVASFNATLDISSDYNMKLDINNNQLGAEFSLSKLIFSNSKVRQLYGLEISDREGVIAYAGSKKYTVDLKTTDQSLVFKVVETEGAISTDFVMVDLTVATDPDMQGKFSFNYMNEKLITLLVNYVPDTNKFVLSYDHFINSKSTVDFTIVMNSENPSVSLEMMLASRDVLSTNAMFAQTAEGYEVSGKLRYQFTDYQEPVLVTVSHTFSSNPKGLSTSGSFQLNDLPATNFAVLFSQELSDSQYNYSLSASLENGALSDLVNFRTFSIAAWQQQERSGRKLFPSCSYTAIVDGEEYHVSYDSQVSSSQRTTRFDMDLQVRHPHDVELFGMPIPKRNKLGFNLMQRKRGVRVMADYDCEYLINPVKMTKSWRTGKDGAVDGMLTVNYVDSEDSLLKIAYNLALVPDTDSRVLTFNLQHPFSNTRFESSFTAISAGSETGFEASLTNFKSEESEKWLLSVVYDNSVSLVKLVLERPGSQPVTVQANLGQLMSKASDAVQELIAQSPSLNARIVYGIDSVEGGYDMFIGVGMTEDKSYTLHLKSTVEQSAAEALLYARDVNDVVTEIADIKFSLEHGRFVKLQISANPMLSSVIEDLLMIVEAEYNQKTDWLVSSIIDLVNTLTGTVSGSEQVEASIAELTKAIVASVTNVAGEGKSMMSNGIVSVTGLLEDGELIVEESVQSAIVNVMQMIADATKFLAQPFEDVVQHFYGEFLSQVKSLLASVLSPMKQGFDVINAGDLFMEAVDDAITQTANYIRANGNEFFFAFRGPLKNLVSVTDTEILITIPLSFELENVNFVELPTTDAIESWFTKTSFSEHVKQLIPQLYTYMDYFYRTKAFFNTPICEQLPPFKGRAFVSDFKSFRTFDGHHYNFDSNCESSHVLVTDGSNGNFTVLVSYGSTPHFDIRIGSENVIIAADATVLYDQNTAILPIISSSGLNVNRMGDSIKLVYNDDLSLEFDTKTNLLSVEINPFYFASTGGLLGKFDNEPNFDYIIPSGEKVNDMMLFVKSWEVSSTMCARRNEVSYAEAPSTCQDLFTSNSSPFRACFPVIQPKHFEDMCSMAQVDICKISKAYQVTCKVAGVSIAMPDSCNQCVDSTGTPFAVGETVAQEITSVDVVMVIQETQCLRTRSKALGKFLRKFLKQTSNAFKSVQLPDTKFYVVGYGGPGSNNEPHSFTMRGKLSSSRKSDVAKVIKKIQLSDEGTPSDAVTAIDFASKLSFRPGAQQVIVHISCDECSQSTMASQVQSNLQERNIAFHHMPIKTIETSTDTKSVHGFSNDKAFAKKTKNFDRALIQPSSNDQCIPIALASSGSVWNGVEMKSSELINNFTNYMTLNVVPGGTRTCTCQVNEAGAVSARCVTA